MRVLRQGWRWLADTPHQVLGVRNLQRAIGAMLLFRALTAAPFVGYLWGPHGLGWGSAQPLLGPTLGGLVDGIFATEAGALVVLVVLTAASLGLLFGYRTDVSTALALVAVVLLEQRLPDLVDGGDMITRLVLFYLLFAIPAGAKPFPGSLAVWLHNIAVLAIALQVMVVYTASGLVKTYGDNWQHGTAVYYASQVESMSWPPTRELFKDPLVTTVATYTTLLYELLFSIAMLSPLRLVWLAFGILLHLGIAVVLGLVTFSMVMIGLLLFFVSDAEYARLQRWSDCAWRRLSARCRASPWRGWQRS
jgi:hypothetical protein